MTQERSRYCPSQAGVLPLPFPPPACDFQEALTGESANSAQTRPLPRVISALPVCFWARERLRASFACLCSAS